MIFSARFSIFWTLFLTWFDIFPKMEYGQYINMGRIMTLKIKLTVSASMSGRVLLNKLLVPKSVTTVFPHFVFMISSLYLNQFVTEENSLLRTFCIASASFLSGNLPCHRHILRWHCYFLLIKSTLSYWRRRPHRLGLTRHGKILILNPLELLKTVP